MAFSAAIKSARPGLASRVASLCLCGRAETAENCALHSKCPEIDTRAEIKGETLAELPLPRHKNVFLVLFAYLFDWLVLIAIIIVIPDDISRRQSAARPR